MILSTKTDRRAKEFLFLGDLILILSSFALAWLIRFKSGIIPLHKEFQAFSLYIIPFVVVSIVWLIAFSWQKLFRIEFSRKLSQELTKILKSSIVALIFSMSLTFLYREITFSRVTLAIGFIITIILTAIYHRIVLSILKNMLLKGKGVAKKLVIGDGDLPNNVIAQILADPLTNRGLVGRLCTEQTPMKIGTPSQLKEILLENQIDEVVLAEPGISETAIRRFLYECRKEKVLFTIVPTFQSFLRGKIEIEQIGQIGSVVFRDVAMTSWQRYIKRVIDILVGSLAIIILSPLILILAIAIKIDSKGPVFFTQERVGKNGRLFNMIKFRSMAIDAEDKLKEYLHQNEAEGAVFKIKEDPRITRVGKFLRRFSLDELPQLFNVIRGEMSLIGPRPPLERELAEYETWQLKRVDTVPGMTGLWQVSGRSDLPFSQMVQMDIYYIEHWSLWLDMKILFKTIPAVISGRGAY